MLECPICHSNMSPRERGVSSCDACGSVAHGACLRYSECPVCVEEGNEAKMKLTRTEVSQSVLYGAGLIFIGTVLLSVLFDARKTGKIKTGRNNRIVKRGSVDYQWDVCILTIFGPGLTLLGLICLAQGLRGRAFGSGENADYDDYDY